MRLSNLLGPSSRAARVMAAFSLSTLLAQQPPQPFSAYEPPNSKAATPSASLPSELHFCAQHCLTFKLAGGEYVNTTLLPGQRNVKRVLKVERFTPDAVIFQRTDTGDFPMKAQYSGQPANETLAGNGWKLAWGNSINTIPGADPQPQATAANNPMMALLGELFAAAASDDDSSSGGGLQNRIRSLRDQISEATIKCNQSRPDLPPCTRLESLRSQLSSAYSQLNREISQLRDLCEQLNEQCRSGNDEACKNLEKAKRQLAQDQMPIM